MKLTHGNGEARSGALSIPPSGAGMADALQLCGERQSEAQWRAANLCRIAWSDSAGEWRLTNSSQTLMCVREGERVLAGASVPITPGDTLELGLLRFIVEQDLPADPTWPRVPTPERRWVADVEPRGLSPTPAVEASPFDLRALAFDDRSAGDGSAQESHVDVLVNPFGILDIAGAQPSPVADVLAGLLGEAPVAVQARPAARLASPPTRGDGRPASLLEELHEEFVRVVRDPAQLAGRVDWEGLLASGNEAAPTLDELRKQAEPYPLLRDILLPREGIDRIIEDFEPLMRSGLLDPEVPEDVLGLFAPELARDSRAPLPSLTRQEHHDLSPDSHIRLGTAQQRDAGSEGEERS
ncbi:TagK domain-containing protein [Variovorax paradoxus]|uniref:TagK domain-containing protein n=1 Tax=Variovorax paradoxus TaxID=34073 RepID=UPI001884F240|nr:TagK domain-containing protein [Variovorax paradoxus]